MQAAALRQQIEQTLSRRVEAALTPRLRQAPERLSTGIAALDHLLGGGMPEGAISELVGPPSSGRTAVALAFTAARLQESRVAAWIDASDTLDPESAAALGVPLEQLLWVRCGSTSTGRHTRQEISHEAPQKSTETLDSRGVSVDRSLSVPAQSGGGGSPHPRTEARGLPEALQTFIGESGPPSRTHVGGNRGLVPPRRRDKSIGTPGAPNRLATGSAPAAADAPPQSRLPAPSAPKSTRGSTQPLHWRSPHREEQVATDRLPARRGEQITDRAAAATWSPRCAEPQPRRSNPSPAPATNTNASTSKQEALSANSSPQPHGKIPIAQSTAAARTFFKNLSDQSGASPRPSTSGSLRGIDQALRAADLLLQSNGFGVIVLDLASFPPEVVWRIPLSTWFRFRAAAERSRACLLLLTQHPCARSSAELILDLHADGFTTSGSVMTGIRWHASVARRRFAVAPSPNVISIRKPPQSEHPGSWAGAAPWTPPSSPSPPSLEAHRLSSAPGPLTTAAESHSAANPSLPELHHAPGKLAAFPKRPA